MFSDRLKFYADTPRGEKNKMFCFKVDQLTMAETLKRFLGNNFVIRACWYEKIDTETGEVIENTRIPSETIQGLFNEVVKESVSKHSHYKN